MLFCSKITTYDVYERNVRHLESVNYKKVIVLHRYMGGSNISAMRRREYECDYSRSRMATPLASSYF